MPRYTEFTLRFADGDPAFPVGIGGTIDANLSRGTVTIHSVDDPRGQVTIEDEDFESFLDCLLEIKAKREEAGRAAA